MATPSTYEPKYSNGKAQVEFAPTLPGYENINRYWDNTRNRTAAKIMPGQCYVTIRGELITTVLGSCVSACIRDAKLGIGGMNHFMLPHSDNPENWGGISSAARYGSYAMETLINEVMKAGGTRRNLEVKAFGGGRIVNQMIDIGEQNIHFLMEYLKLEGMRLVSHDLGSVYPRKVVYYPDSGKVQVKRLRKLHNLTILERENQYLHTIEEKPVQGDIELF